MKGLELRDAIASDYARNARRRGVQISQEEANKIAAADLQLVDAYEAGAAPAPTKKKADAPKKNRVNKGEMFADAKGYTRTGEHNPLIGKRPKPTDLRGVYAERFGALMARIKRILQRTTLVIKPGSSMADAPFAYPALAKSVLTEHADYSFKRRKYRDLNAKDGHRAFWRAMEDIADRSTGALGPWWVK